MAAPGTDAPPTTRRLDYLEERWQGRSPERQRRLGAVIPLDGVEVLRGDQRLINFSGNDYLGLARDPRLITAVQAATERWGCGATGSRLVVGSLPEHLALEQELAAFCNREAALLFNSGYQANVSILPTLLDRHCRVYVDRLAHRSLLAGVQASEARWQRYPHNDYDRLEALLRQAPADSRRWIVSETVFSMDGDRADLERLTALARRYDAGLYLDDAHAFGILGPEGSGLATRNPEVDVVVGTFGKACGGFGAFVAGSQRLIDTLINFCPGFIYTTALPPGVVAGLRAAIALLPRLEAERQHLHGLAERLREGLQRLGYDSRSSASAIVPALVGTDARALALAAHLEAHGCLGIPIRPPTVPEGTARLRLTLSAAMQGHHLDQLLTALETWDG